MGYPPQGYQLPSSYTSTRAGYLDELAAANLPSDLDDAHDALYHTTAIFPSDTNLTCTFTAHATANTWSAWAEITDSGSNTLSALFASVAGHITALLIEDMSVEDKLFHLELSYGSAKTNILSHRFLKASTKKTTLAVSIRIRASYIPEDETVYYRLMCETASATCDVSFRYHFHS